MKPSKILSLALLFVCVLLPTIIATSCDDYQSDYETCMSSAEDGEPCAFCAFSGLGTTTTVCLTEEEAKKMNGIYECEYQASSVRRSILPAFNETDFVRFTSGYSSSNAVKYADSYCASHSEWLCAEFVARALNAGSTF